AEIGEIAIERRGRAAAGFLDRMDGEFKGDSACVADAILDAGGEDHVDAVAGREVAAGLGDADDGPSRLQLLAGEAKIVEALEVDCRLAGLGHVVEPDFAAQGFGHDVSASLASTPKMNRPFRGTIYSQGEFRYVQ